MIEYNIRMVKQINLSKIFRFRQHYLISTPFYGLNFTAKQQKNGATILSDVQFFANGFLKENASLDTTTIKNLKGNKKLIHIIAPSSLFLYKTNLENKQRTQGVKALIPLLKDRFNIDLSQNKVGALDAETGKEIQETTALLPENICILGARKEELHQIQTDLVTNQFVPQKLHFSVLHVPQGLASYQAMIHSHSPILFLDFSMQKSCIYIVGNGQILAAYPPTHGLKNLLTLGRKALNLQDDVTTLQYLTKQIANNMEGQKTLLSRMVSDVKSYINFFEIQANVSIDGIFVNGLMNEFSWIETYLANALEMQTFAINYQAWLNTENIVLPQDVQIPQKALFGMINAIIHYRQ